MLIYRLDVVVCTASLIPSFCNLSVQYNYTNDVQIFCSFTPLRFFLLVNFEGCIVLGRLQNNENALWGPLYPKGWLTVHFRIVNLRIESFVFRTESVIVIRYCGRNSERIDVGKHTAMDTF